MERIAISWGGGGNFNELITHEDYLKALKARREYDFAALSKADIGFIGFVASYNGRFFNGYSGRSNVKVDRDYIGESIRNIKKQLPALSNVKFLNYDYCDVKLPESDRCVIYCDIPYKGVKGYSVGDKFDYDKFYNWCREKSKLGYRIFISEYSMPEDFEVVWEKEVKCTMNQTTTKTQVEKLFTLKV